MFFLHVSYSTVFIAIHCYFFRKGLVTTSYAVIHRFDAHYSTADANCVICAKSYIIGGTGYECCCSLCFRHRMCHESTVYGRCLFLVLILIV